MRIAVYCHRLDRTGAPLLLFRLVRWLRLRHAVTVLATPAPLGNLADDYRALGVPVVPSLQTDDADVFLCNTIMSSRLLGTIGRHAPTLLWVHEPAHGRLLIESGKADPACFATATRVVFPTLWQAEGPYRDFLTRGNWEVVPAGLEEGSAPRPCPFRREPGKVYLFQHGVLDARKGQDLAIQALARLDPSVELFLAGSLDFNPDFVARTRAYLARRPDLQARVHLLGPLPEKGIDAWLQHCDALVFPTRDDLIPLAVLEAMAAGRCVVASDYGAIPETVEHQVSGLLSPVDDIPALAANLARIAADPTLRCSLGEQGRCRFRQRHGFEGHVLGMERALERAAGAWRPG